MQHEGDVEGFVQPRDEIQVECRTAVGHRVRRSHRHRQSVHSRLGDERPCLMRVGAHTRRVRPVFAADLAELTLDAGAGSVRAAGDLGRQREVLVIRQRSAVEHDRAEAQRDRLIDELRGLGMIEVHGDRGLGAACDRQCRQRDRFQCTA